MIVIASLRSAQTCGDRSTPKKNDNSLNFDVGCYGYTKTLVEQLLRGFLLFNTSNLVTFGHHFENGGPKKRQKGAEKNVGNFAF